MFAPVGWTQRLHRENLPILSVARLVSASRDRRLVGGERGLCWVGVRENKHTATRKFKSQSSAVQDVLSSKAAVGEGWQTVRHTHSIQADDVATHEDPSDFILILSYLPHIYFNYSHSYQSLLRPLCPPPLPPCPLPHLSLMPTKPTFLSARMKTTLNIKQKESVSSNSLRL